MYDNAEIVFKGIINMFPDSTESYYSFAGLYDCYKKREGTWSELHTYLNGLSVDSGNIHNSRIISGYLNLCKREMGLYDEALTNYESILQNNPSFTDSVFAIINIGNTLLEAQGAFKSTSSIYDQYRSVSISEHAVKTKKLLLMLQEDSHNEYDNQSTSKEIISCKTFPNPFRNDFTIELDVKKQADVFIRICDAYGVLKDELKLGNLSKGKYTYQYYNNDLNSGIYFYSIYANGEMVENLKIIVQ